MARCSCLVEFAVVNVAAMVLALVPSVLVRACWMALPLALATDFLSVVQDWANFPEIPSARGVG
jgi:hypothetical protein